MVEQRLRSTREWDIVADLVHGKDFASLPPTISMNFAMCFLIQTTALEEYTVDYLQAFA